MKYCDAFLSCNFCLCQFDAYFPPFTVEVGHDNLKEQGALEILYQEFSSGWRGEKTP